MLAVTVKRNRAIGCFRSLSGSHFGPTWTLAASNSQFEWQEPVATYQLRRFDVAKLLYNMLRASLTGTTVSSS